MLRYDPDDRCRMQLRRFGDVARRFATPRVVLAVHRRRTPRQFRVVGVHDGAERSSSHRCHFQQSPGAWAVGHRTGLETSNRAYFRGCNRENASGQFREARLIRALMDRIHRSSRRSSGDRRKSASAGSDRRSAIHRGRGRSNIYARGRGSHRSFSAGRRAMHVPGRVKPGQQIADAYEL